MNQAEFSFPVKLILCGISGIMISASYHEYNLYFLMWVAHVPALCALKGETLFDNYLHSSLLGALAYFLSLDWIVNLFENFVFIPYPYSLFAFIGYSFLFGQTFALSYTLSHWLSGKFPRVDLLIFPSITISCFLLIPNIFYNLPADSQLDFRTAIQPVEYLGSVGLSWIILLSNKFISKLCLGYKKPVEKWEAGFTAGILAVWFTVGAVRLNYWESEIKNWESLKVGVVQTNRPISEKRQTNAEKMKNFEFQASLDLSKENPLFIVWPEGTSYGYRKDGVFRSFFDDFLTKLRTPLVMQGVYYERAKGEIRSYNSTFLYNEEGEVEGRYDKIKLIPFGEKIPFQDITNFFLSFVGLRMSSFNVGEKQTIFQLGDIEMIVRICYESIFGSFIAEGVAGSKAKKIAVIQTESEWYDSAKEIKQHSSATSLRAVENRIPLIHVINGGYSSLTLPTGEVKYVAPYHEKKAYIVDVPYNKDSPLTFYSKYPLLPVYLVHGFSFSLLFGALYLQIFYRKRKYPNHSRT